MIRKNILLLFLFLSGTTFAQVQKFTISGFVYEKSSHESLPGILVVNTKTGAGTATNNFGFYSLTLPSDTVLITCSFVGYKTEIRKFFLDKNTQINFDLDALLQEEVVINAEQDEKISDNTQMSQVSIPIEQIKQIPALLGEKDVLKVIQLMPGVQSGGEGNSGLYVRGGGADQNLIILDDATVYNAYHLFGFFSLFNGDALKSVELTKGGFPARYGGRLSSVLEMQMKDGNQEKFSGEAGIGIISSRLLLEGPLKKKKSSFLVSGRRTYIDALVYPFLPDDNKAGYYFYDFNAKVNYTVNDKNRLFLSGYFGKDKFYANYKNGPDYKEKVGLNWGNATGTLRWNHLWSDRLFSNTALIFTNYKFGIKYSEESAGAFTSLNYSSGIRDFSIKHDFDFSPVPDHYLKFGFISTYHRFTPSAVVLKSSNGPDNSSKVKTLEAVESGIYIEDDWRITSRLKTNIGFRLSHFNTQGKSYVRPEPRFAARYILRENLSLKASYALMNQYLHLLSNTGIGLPTDLWVPATKRIKPQQSQQVALGSAMDIPKYKLMVSLEGYYKWSKDVVGYKEGASFLLVNDLGGNEEPVNWEDNVTPGKAWSYGFEFLVQRKFGKLTGWVGYTLSWSQLQFDSINFGNKYYAKYDRRHDISVVGIYKINDHITLSATWVFGTGNAITLPLAEYALTEHDPSGSGVQQNVPRFNNWFVNDYGDKNSFRMAPYHRMDIALQFHRKMKYWDRTFELGVYNLYNRKNPFFYYVGYDNSGQQRKLKQISLFPLIPSVSWTIKF
ncbi:MAG: TonB-dependent receptor [Bacteroidia bacterium]